MVGDLKKGWWLVGILIIVIVLFLIVRPSGELEEPEEGCLSLTFDDGLKSHYTTVYPMLKERGFGATFFVMAEQEEDPDGRAMMTSEEVQELAEEGFEIGSHTLTHPFLSDLSDEELEQELSESKRFLEETYGITINFLALPYRNYNSKVLDVAKKYYAHARVIFGDPDEFLVNGYGMMYNSSVEDVCSYINGAATEKEWLVLVFHDVIERPLVWDTSVEDFEAILQCSEDSGIIVDTMTGCNELYKNL